METVSRTEDRVEELRGRIDDLEQQKVSLEGEISALVELVRDMLQAMTHDRLGAESGAAAVPPIQSN